MSDHRDFLEEYTHNILQAMLRETQLRVCYSPSFLSMSGPPTELASPPVHSSFPAPAAAKKADFNLLYEQLQQGSMHLSPAYNTEVSTATKVTWRFMPL